MSNNGTAPKGLRLFFPDLFDLGQKIQVQGQSGRANSRTNLNAFVDLSVQLNLGMAGHRRGLGSTTAKRQPDCQRTGYPPRAPGDHGISPPLPAAARANAATVCGTPPKQDFAAPTRMRVNPKTTRCHHGHCETDSELLLWLERQLCRNDPPFCRARDQLERVGAHAARPLRRTAALTDPGLCATEWGLAPCPITPPAFPAWPCRNALSAALLAGMLRLDKRHGVRAPATTAQPDVRVARRDRSGREPRVIEDRRRSA